MRMEILIAIVITFAVTLSGTWITKDILELNKPPKTQKIEIVNTTVVDVQTKSEMRNYTVQQTAVYNQENEGLIFALTNQTAYSNLLKSLITNSNRTQSKTNETNY